MLMHRHKLCVAGV